MGERLREGEIGEVCTEPNLKVLLRCFLSKDKDVLNQVSHLSRTSQNAPQVTSCLSLSLAQQNYEEGPPKELLSEETLDFIANDLMPAFKAMLEDEELREVILSHF